MSTGYCNSAQISRALLNKETFGFRAPVEQEVVIFFEKFFARPYWYPVELIGLLPLVIQAIAYFLPDPLV